MGLMWQTWHAYFMDLACAVVASLVAPDGVPSPLLLQAAIPASPEVDDEPAHQRSASRAPRV